MPSGQSNLLLAPQSSDSGSNEPGVECSANRIHPLFNDISVLILVSSALRLIWAAGMELGNDEAYHYLYTVHPDWSYFDHPPLLMWIARIGIALCGGWVHPLSIRLGFVLLFAGSTWLMFDWTSRWFGRSAGWFAAFALNVAAYFSAAAGAFVLPDGPLLFFWIATLRALTSALFMGDVTEKLRTSFPPARLEKAGDIFSEQSGGLWAWTLVGLGCAGGMASKYHAVLLPFSTVVYLMLTPRRWSVLKTPGPYMATVIGMLGLLPVLIWNAQHQWASFAFQGSRAVGTELNLRGLITMVAGPIGYLLPWIWGPAVMVLFSRLRRFNRLEGIERFLICMSAVPLTLFFCVSSVRPILPHWPLVGFIPLFPLIGSMWDRNSLQTPILVRRWVVFMSIFTPAIAFVFYCQARFGMVDFPDTSDPAREISGWESVGIELEKRGLLDRPNTFLFTDHWYDSGQLAFSIRNRCPVLCYSPGDARGFAYWSRADQWVGKDGLLVCTEESPNLELYRPYFRQIEPLAQFRMTRSGKPFRPVQVYLCTEQTRPFPFEYAKLSR